MAMTEGNDRTGNDQRMQLREEVLQVQKEWVQTGEIRIRKRVITEEKVFRVPVSREEVIIERVSLNGQPSNETVEPNASLEADEGEILSLGDGETVKILVLEEQVTINKIPIVIEEITLTKRVLQEMKQITENVQREKVRIERRGNADIQSDNIDDVSLQSYQGE
jgi:uncharacterized protein (TIGR02271 family)